MYTYWITVEAPSKIASRLHQPLAPTSFPLLMAPTLLNLPQFPDHSVEVSIWTAVSNAADIKRELIEANPQYGHFAFINADMVVSKAHLYSALHRALTNSKNDTMTSKTLNTEATIALSPNNKKITDNLKKFGLTETSERLLVVEFIPTNQKESHYDSLSTMVKGTEVDVADEVLWQGINWDEVIKVYKLDKAKKEQYQTNQALLFNLLNGAIQLSGL